MIIKHFLITIVSFLLLVSCAYPESFTFSATSKEAQWIFYGEGSASYVTDMGRGANPTSIKLSADFGESHTAYFTWKDLTPGNYKVVTYVRAEDVAPGADGFSFWHFHEGGFGTISTFTDLHGSYEWRKVEYTIKVKDKDLTVWFRIKSPGTIWVDEFSLQKDNNVLDKPLIENPQLLKTTSYEKRNIIKKSSAPKKLFTFESSEAGHPFKVMNKAGKFSAKDYHNFKLDKLAVKDWSAFDRLEMDIYNPNSIYAPFFVTLADDKTTNYWSQTNFKQTLAPGWNHLSLPLTQYVGERGSHRFNRSLNLNKLTKFFIAVDPESKLEFSRNDFLIDNVTLTSNPYPQIPASVKSFDFTSQKASDETNLTKVTTQTLFNEKRGYGFISPQFWRVEDSQYASAVNRHSIGILSGKFNTLLPNGNYQIALNLEKLGYWDVPFWSERAVIVNGSPLFSDRRNKGTEYLNDLLRFSTVTPTLNDNPYDLYLKKIFIPVEKTVEVKNGTLEFEFNADASGISLNSLVIWNKANDQEGRAYMTALDKRNKQEFNWMSRSIQFQSTAAISSFGVGIVEPTLTLTPKTLNKITADSLSFSGGSDETSYQVIQITNGPTEEKLSWKLSDLKNESGKSLPKNLLSINDVIFQYTSPDTNHETYLLTGKFLKPINDNQITLKKNESRFLWIKLSVNKSLMKGKYSGDLVFTKGSEQKKLPISVTILPYSLPAIDFPVGFFGIDPLPYSYFKNSDYNSLRKKYRHLALHKIGQAGFTTFTGLPENTDELQELFTLSSKYNIQTVYSYGGQFPQSLIDLNKKPSDMSEDIYLKKAAGTLKGILSKKSWPKVVHTFSDEAGGYSDKISADIEMAKKLKNYFPFMAIGGFGFFEGSDTAKLNNYFDYGFYSSLTKGHINKLKDQNQRWGFYNASAGNLDDPRFSYGLGLYIARLNGLSQYLEWNATSFNNYPYYDFDGRESDIVMFYPTLNGELLNSLRFELSVDGIQTYRKLKLLESAINTGQGTKAHRDSAHTWMNALKKKNYFYSSNKFMNQKNSNFKELSSTLDTHLKNLFN